MRKSFNIASSILIAVLLVFGTRNSVAAKSGDFIIFANGNATDIFMDKDDFMAARIAAEALAGDIELLSGVKPAVVNVPGELGPSAVIAGTIGRSGIVDEIIASKGIDVSSVEGKWESFLLSEVEAPLPGVESALLIAGSDRRGTAFGIFEVSESIGVSPWVWWADVTPAKKDMITVDAGTEVHGPPSVKYRGIFLNDEDFGLQPWAAKTFEPGTGDIGPETYAKIFELLLRLKANYIWPAMHKCTKAFNYFEENKFVADDYGIVMGSSHCEQMLRNNVDEWPRDGKGSWDYGNNRENIVDYWEKRVEENGGFENIYTLGMRGIHDSPMTAGRSLDEKTDILENIIRDQRELLAEHVDENPARVPQVFCPYKEVLDLYRNDLEVPGDVTLLWVDDNHGFIRQLSTPEEQQRPGGSGVYYHISYWGHPHHYLWLDTIPVQLIWEEMHKAYQYGARDVWILNVGDIKPHEIGTEFFLEMAWDIDRWNLDSLGDFTRWWAAREFGPEHAPEIAAVMDGYFLLNHRRKPEHMGFYDAYSLLQQNQDPEFSLYNYGDEAQQRLDAFDEITGQAEAVYEQLPRRLRDAYFQLVLYPVRGAANMNRKHLHAYKSREYARQGRVSANDHAEKAKRAYAGILEDTRHYNETMAGGKWNGMMSHRPNDLPVFGKVKLGRVKPVEKPAIGVAVEGRSKPLEPGDSASLPAFNRYTKRKHFIDIFNRGQEPVEWKAEPFAGWILIGEESGSVETERRLWIDMDYSSVPPGDRATGKIHITGAGDTFDVTVEVFNPPEPQLPAGTFVEENGVISIDAENFSENVAGPEGEWKIVRCIGRTGAALSIFPVTAPSVLSAGEIPSRAPSVEFPVYVFEGGRANVTVHAVPTHEIHAGRFLECALSVDGGTPVIIEFAQSNDEVEDVWQENVLRATMAGGTEIDFKEGPATLKLWGMDPSVLPDKIVVDFGGLEKSYLGPPETVVK